MKTVNLKAPENKVLAAIVRTVGSRKQKAFVTVTDSALSMWGYWDGGSRDEWDMITLFPAPSQDSGYALTYARIPVSANPPQFGGKVTELAPTDEGALGFSKVIVRSGICMGKPATPHIYISSNSPILASLKLS